MNNKKFYFIATILAVLITVGVVASTTSAFDGKPFKSPISEEQKKAKYEAFEAKAESMAMTVTEYKEYLAEQYEAKAESMGMTVEEFKKYLIEQKKI